MNFSKLYPWLFVIGGAAVVPTIEGCRTNQSVGSQVSDSSITAAVKTKMVGDDDVKARNIDVTTDHGIVYLTGRVATQHEKDQAERLARSCDGVRDVVNHLEIQPG